MTTAEEIAAIRAEMRAGFAAIRRENQDALSASAARIRDDFAPAMAFYEMVNSVGRAIRWGAALGASVVPIVVGLKALGIL